MKMMRGNKGIGTAIGARQYEQNGPEPELGQALFKLDQPTRTEFGNSTVREEEKKEKEEDKRKCENLACWRQKCCV